MGWRQDLTQLTSVFALLLLQSCGGEVHFVNEAIQAPPKLPGRPHPTYQERFRYGQSSGVPYVFFSFYQRQSMQPIRDTLYQHIDEFLDLFWAGGGGFADAHIGVVPDTTSPGFEQLDLKRSGYDHVNWVDISKFKMRNWIASAPLDQINPDVWPGGGFKNIVEKEVKAVDQDALPAWIEIVYLRNREITFSNEGDEQRVRAMKIEFDKSFTHVPFSKFRYQIHTLSYQNNQLGCVQRPEDLATKMKSLFADYSGSSLELCGMGQAQMADLAQKMLGFSSRVILAQEAKGDTLVAKLSGKVVPRQMYKVQKDTNEIIFSQEAIDQYQPAIGSLIEVSYEAK